MENIDYENKSVDIDRELNGQLLSCNGSGRISGYLNEQALTPSVEPPRIELENALMLVARIGL